MQTVCVVVTNYVNNYDLVGISPDIDGVLKKIREGYPRSEATDWQHCRKGLKTCVINTFEPSGQAAGDAVMFKVYEVEIGLESGFMPLSIEL